MELISNIKKSFKTISPIDGKIFCEQQYESFSEINKKLKLSISAQKEWLAIPIEKKINIIKQFLTNISQNKDKISEEISYQMGRPIIFGKNEINTLIHRTEYMLSIAKESLSDIKTDENKFIKKTPLGTVLVIAPWNYPYITAINSIVPALLAGNSVILKHSTQTPICSLRFFEAFENTDMPKGVFQDIQFEHNLVSQIIETKKINFINFTGSIESGIKLYKIAAENLIDVGLELGGKDAAYVRNDTKIDFAAEKLVEGAFFNSGQSCCGIERIYVQEGIYEHFLKKFANLTKKLKLGNPLEKSTTIGPMAKKYSADFLRGIINQAIKQGAKSLVPEAHFPLSKSGTPYLAPHVLVDVNHDMSIMQQESFGPVVGIMKVKGDQEAIDLMNDSHYGLSASIWTQDIDKGKKLANQVEAGTCFINKCDYLDPALAWCGVKESGLGCTLSKLGFDQFTKPKSFLIAE